MTLDDCDKLKDIDPQHYIEKAWRLSGDTRVLIDLKYHEKDWPDGYARYRHALERIIKNDGLALGAFNPKGKLKGYIALDKTVFGRSAKYMLLDSLFVSYDVRDQGIGGELFRRISYVAKESGGEKLYICAGSAENTIAFYRRCGCVDAKEINQDLYEEDIRDLQLEFKL